MGDVSYAFVIRVLKVTRVMMFTGFVLIVISFLIGLLVESSVWSPRFWMAGGLMMAVFIFIALANRWAGNRIKSFKK